MSLAETKPYEVVDGFKTEEIKPLPKHVLLRWFKKTETKGGIAIPQYRQRAGFMKGQILAVGEDCDSRLKPGVFVEFNGLGLKEWVGEQDPEHRDTVFVTRVENLYAIIVESDCGSPLVQAIGYWVFVRPDEPPKEKGGLVIPESARAGRQRREQGLIGTIVSCGFETEFIRNQRVAFNATGATAIHLGDHNDEVVLIVDADDIEGEVE